MRNCVLLVALSLTISCTVSSGRGTVTMDGVGFPTIQGALDSISDGSEHTIILTPGVYNENYINYKGAATVRIKGQTSEKYGSDVIITGHGTKMSQEKGRELLEFQGSGNLILENLTLKSDWSRKDVSGDA